MHTNLALVPPVLSSRLLEDYPTGRTIKLSGHSMWTTSTVQVACEEDPPQLERLVQAALQRVIAQMSSWEPDSDLSRFNRASPGTWRMLPPECLEVLSCALSFAESTQGAYDPSIGALTNLWGFGPAGPRTTRPAAREIDAARARTGWQQIKLARDERRLYQPGGIELDLSSIAKGFAVDQVGRALETRGITHYLVEIGGELRRSGCKPDGTPWWVEIEPLEPSQTRTLVALHELSIATSGDYRRYFERDGVRYSHTLDPRTGAPVRNDLAAVTVLAPQCMHADALA